jgi:hypothetical protein
LEFEPLKTQKSKVTIKDQPGKKALEKTEIRIERDLKNLLHVYDL